MIQRSRILMDLDLLTMVLQMDSIYNSLKKGEKHYSKGCIASQSVIPEFSTQDNLLSFFFSNFNVFFKNVVTWHRLDNCKTTSCQIKFQYFKKNKGKTIFFDLHKILETLKPTLKQFLQEHESNAPSLRNLELGNEMFSRLLL